MNSEIMVGRDNTNHGKCKYLSILEEGLKMGGCFPIPTIIVRARIVPENFPILKAVTLHVVANASNASNHRTCGVDCQVFKVNQDT